MEEWRDVIGYEGLYEVSNLGNVRSCEHFTNGHHLISRVLKQNLNNRYMYVKLYKNHTKRSVRVHRIVAMAFIPNQDGKPQVNHIDGNRLNNSASNLEWCTQSENIRHAIDIGLQDPTIMIEASKKKVLQLSLEGDVIKEWDSLTAAANALGVQVSNISHCCSGRIRQTGGFKWRRSSEL